jgi:RNA polymerase sigma factor (sigma-70 family)
MHTMEEPDPYGEWVILQGKQDKPGALNSDEELLTAAREAWPRALAHARRELRGKTVGPDRAPLAEEIWEKVLRSVLRTRQRLPHRRPQAADLPAYLMGAFHRRLNRVLRREQRRRDVFDLFPSSLALEKCESARDIQWASQLEQDIALETVLAHMDESTRAIYWARQFGYSWKEIAGRLGISERHAKRKLADGIEKTRKRLIALMLHRREQFKDRA